MPLVLQQAQDSLGGIKLEAAGFAAEIGIIGVPLLFSFPQAAIRHFSPSQFRRLSDCVEAFKLVGHSLRRRRRKQSVTVRALS